MNGIELDRGLTKEVGYMMEVIDNALPQKQFDSIKYLIYDDQETFPWFYQDAKVTQEDNPEDFYDYGFCHSFIRDYKYVSPMPKEYTRCLDPIYELLNSEVLIRVKANLTMAAPILYEYGWHRDINHRIPSKTAVFYLNTNNGGTLFEDGTRVDSVENRIAIFDERISHTGTSCTDSKRRVVLNINYIPRA